VQSNAAVGRRGFGSRDQRMRSQYLSLPRPLWPVPLRWPAFRMAGDPSRAVPADDWLRHGKPSQDPMEVLVAERALEQRLLIDDARRFHGTLTSAS
jgi:hypothetical protein